MGITKDKYRMARVLDHSDLAIESEAVAPTLRTSPCGRNTVSSPEGVASPESDSVPAPRAMLAPCGSSAVSSPEDVYLEVASHVSPESNSVPAPRLLGQEERLDEKPIALLH